MKSYFKVLLIVYAGFILSDLIVGLIATLGIYLYMGSVSLAPTSEILMAILVQKPLFVLPELLGISYVVNKFLNRAGQK